MEACGAHWTTWTYKDVGIMGLATLAPDSPYMRTIGPVLAAKRRLHAEGWGWLAPAPMQDVMDLANRLIGEALGDPAVGSASARGHLGKVALCTYVAGLLQTPFARCFKGLTESQIDRTLQSFRLKNCVINEGQVAVLRKHMRKR